MSTAADQLKVNTSLFVGFTGEDLKVLAPAALRRTLCTGEVLCHRGESGSSMYIISVGSIEVRRPVGETDVALATLKRGEACGEVALVSGGVRTADLIAAEDSAVLEISRKSLDDALAGHPEVAAKLWRNIAVALSQRLESTNSLLAKSIELNWKLLNNDDIRRAYSGL
jgi:CRP-like cAMP-binding protein